MSTAHTLSILASAEEGLALEPDEVVVCSMSYEVPEMSLSQISLRSINGKMGHIFSVICNWMFHLNDNYKGGSVCAPFTGAAYWEKYFKPVPNKNNQNTSSA